MKKILLAFLPCILYFSAAMAQQSADRLYLHLDKEAYTAGESIWFRGYIHDDSLMVQSTSLQVELLNDSGAVVLKKIFPIVNNQAIGQVELDKALPQRMYYLRAYTAEIQQTGGKQFYRIVPVLSTSVTSAFIAQAVGRELNVQVQPLYGTVVSGSSNVFIYQAYNEYSEPVPVVKGEVKDGAGTVVTTFGPQYPGAGSFALLPFTGEVYTATFTFANGATREVVLPPAAAEGYTMQIRTVAGGKKIMIAKTPGAAAEGVVLTGATGGVEVFQQPLVFSDNYCSVMVPVNAGSNSLVELSVTCSGRTWCSTRILTGDAAAAKAVEATGLSLSAAPKAGNTFNLMYNDSVDASLSVSITDAAYELKSLAPASITSWLTAGRLLKGELTGRQPADLGYHELLLNGPLYQSPVAAGGQVEKHPYIYFRGLVTNAETGKPVKNESVTCMIREKDREPVMNLFQSDDQGYIKADGLFFYDSTALSFFTNQKGEQVAVKVQLLAGEAFTNPARPAYKVPLPLSITRGWQFAAAPDNSTVKLTPVVVPSYRAAGDTATVIGRRSRTSKMQEVVNRYRSGLFIQQPDGTFNRQVRYTFDLVNDPPNKGYQYITQFLKAWIPDVQESVVGGEIGLFRRSKRGVTSVTGAIGGNQQTAVPIFLDENQVTYSMLQGILTADVALVQYFQTGAVSVYLKKPADYPKDSGKTPRLWWYGYSPSTSLEQPEYDDIPKQKELADNRATLYWNPSVSLGPDNRELPVKFYNSDTGRQFKIVVQGMTLDGRYIYFEQYLKP